MKTRNIFCCLTFQMQLLIAFSQTPLVGGCTSNLFSSNLSRFFNHYHAGSVFGIPCSTCNWYFLTVQLSVNLHCLRVASIAEQGQRAWSDFLTCFSASGSAPAARPATSPIHAMLSTLFQVIPGNWVYRSIPARVWFQLPI